MTERCLQITYRKGHPLAAYLYLPRSTNEKSARTEATPTAFSSWTVLRDRASGEQTTYPGSPRGRA